MLLLKRYCAQGGKPYGILQLRISIYIHSRIICYLLRRTCPIPGGTQWRIIAFQPGFLRLWRDYVFAADDPIHSHQLYVWTARISGAWGAGKKNIINSFSRSEPGVARLFQVCRLFCRESEQDRFFNDSPNIVLPTGISVFTFQGMSYVIDVYRGDSVPEKNPLHVALYISLFPQLVAGPIVRYTTVANEIHERRESIEGFSKGGIRFCFGLAKKMILANSLRALADEVFALSVSDLTVSLSWLGAIAYMGQIYFYFSAYSDMAIGLGQMFGFHFLENFNYQISQRALPNSDAAGISVSPRGSSTMSIFLWAEADAAKEGRP